MTDGVLDGMNGAVERLRAADASFLYLETPEVPLHVTGVMVLDTSTVPGGYSFEKAVAHIAERLHLVPPFRRKLLEVPLGIDHPVWIEDPSFDLANHVRRAALPTPGDDRQLADWVGEFASRPLDRSRPLWEMAVIEGLEGGHVALVTKMHHAAVDGITATELLARFVDLGPEPGPVPPDTWAPTAEIPGTTRRVVDATTSRVTDPMRTVRAARRTAGSVVRLGRTLIGRSLLADDSGHPAGRPFGSARGMIARTVTRRRSVAFATSTLEDLQDIGAVFGATVNEAFLAACAASLRAYLLDHGETIDRPLLAMVPVSKHGAVADEAATNQITGMFVRIPAHLADPLEQLRAVQAESTGAKAVTDLIGPDMIGDVIELTPPALVNLASRMYHRLGLSEKLPPIQNLVISNVPGPPLPLYVGGARIRAAYPFGPLLAGSGMNITVLSNMGNMDIGVMGCPDTTPGIDAVSEGIVRAIRHLRKLALETQAEDHDVDHALD